MHIDLYKLLSRRGHGLKSSAAAPSSPANPLFLPRYCSLFYPFPRRRYRLVASFLLLVFLRLHLSRRWIQSLDKYRDNFSPRFRLVCNPESLRNFCEYPNDLTDSPPIRLRWDDTRAKSRAFSNAPVIVFQRFMPSDFWRNEKISRDGNYEQVPIISIR